jgi:hypothetical protein
MNDDRSWSLDLHALSSWGEFDGSPSCVMRHFQDFALALASLAAWSRTHLLTRVGDRKISATRVATLQEFNYGEALEQG